MTGQKKAAMATLERLESISHGHYVSPIARANIYFGLGESGRALDAFDEACSIREPLLIFAHNFPIMDSLRGDPRFVDILKKMGLPS
jgi:hypothetical protein